MEKKILFADKPTLLRAQLLEDNCDEIEVCTYPSDFSEEDMSEMRKELGDIDIEIYEKDEAKKAYMQQLRDELKPLKTRKKELLGDIKRGYEEVTEKCYKFIDRENGVIELYNKQGELVKTRPIGAKEAQRTIIEKINHATGTFD